MYEQIVRANVINLEVEHFNIEHRMNWAEFRRLDRLERALKTAKSRLRMLPILNTEAH